MVTVISICFTQNDWHFGLCILSQCSAVCPCGPQRNRIAIWKPPVPAWPWKRAGMPHGPVHISRDCWDLLPLMVFTVRDGGCDKALLHFVEVGPCLHRMALCWLHWETALFIIVPLLQEVPHHLLKNRCQLPGPYIVRGNHLTKPIEKCKQYLKTGLNVKEGHQHCISPSTFIYWRLLFTYVSPTALEI